MEGKCILYYSHKDVAKLEHLMRDKPLSEREVGAQLINETVSYAESAVCRRKILLNYFGEDYHTAHCDGMANLLLSPMSSDIFGGSVNQPVFKELGFILWTKWIGESNDQSKPISLLKA